MAWTTPKTWSVGETLTAANFNSNIRDDLNYLRTQHKLKIADETVSASTTLQNDDDLVLAVLASEVWLMDLYLVVDSNPTAGLKVGWTVPAGTTMRWASISGTAGGNVWWNNDASNSASALKIASDTITFVAPSAGVVWGVNVKAIITVSSTAGNVQMQWAQGSSSGSTILKAGSLFVAHRVNT